MALARGLLLVVAAAAACLLLAGSASAARLEAQGVHTIAASTDTPSAAASVDAHGPAHGSPQRSLLTYFMSLTKPQLQLSSASNATRPGRTALTVTLSGPAAVSPWMPVVSPRPDGMTHDVVHTWAALKNYALMFTRVNAVNKQAAPGATRLFPLPGVAVQAASDVSPFGKLDVGRIIDSAEAHGQRSAWTEPSPGSVLLLPHGSSTAAVADVMNIAHDEQSGAISLDLELVHSPHTVSEFEAHGKQSLDVHEAHYHFATPPGVAIDAAGLLASLQDARLDVAGLHVFVKGVKCGYRATLTANATNVPVGQAVRINIDVGSSGCSGRSPVGAGIALVVSVTRPATIVDASPNSTPPPPPPAPVRVAGQTATAYTDANGRAWVDVLVQGTGPIKVSVDSINNGSPATSTSITITGVGGSAPAKLLLTPHKAHKHVHQHATVTAVALDAKDAPIAGILVAFSAFGDCQPLVHPTAAVTNDKGWATVHLTSHEPGAVAVVAATAGANGATITSPASHIIWVDEEHGDERDGYYGRDAQSYADAAARLAVAEVTKATTAATPNDN